jgi:hypothetical protein
MVELIDAKKRIYFGNVVISCGQTSWVSRPLDSQGTSYAHLFLPHHQSILYPRSFYELEDYALKYKVISDMDYTLRACKRYDKVHLDIDLVISELKGMGISHFASLRKTLSFCREKATFMKGHPERYGMYFRIGFYFSTLVKYILYKLGGFRMINLYFRAKMTTARRLGIEIYR